MPECQREMALAVIVGPSLSLLAQKVSSKSPCFRVQAPLFADRYT
jgi:hypothetical protein